MAVDNWTQEATDRLKELWKDGRSASIIAEILCKEFGCRLSRNAVLGKVKRLEISDTRNHVIRMYGVKRKVVTRRPQVNRIIHRPFDSPSSPFSNTEVLIALEMPIDGISEGVNYLENPSWGCKALIGKRGSDGLEMCCGKPQGTKRDGSESPYCPAHYHRFIRAAY